MGFKRKIRGLISHFRGKKYKYRYKGEKKLNINIIIKDNGWILEKFANSLCDELNKLGCNAKVSNDYDKSCDINHYCGASFCDVSNNKTTFMITHVDTAYKLETIKRQTNNGALGICMSEETKNRLVAAGVVPNRVCYISPAQDGLLKPKKITLGFTHRVYGDNRKRESMIVDVCKKVNASHFKIVIMGSGWEEIVKQLVELGVEVDYYSDFDKTKYNALFDEMDYYCYFGFDEGSMGFLDAIASGTKTIVTPQGYHLDSGCGIDYPVRTIQDIVDALNSIDSSREKYYKFLDTWTWENFAKKHLQLWEYMTGCKRLEEILSNRGWYKDGIYSLLLEDLDEFVPLIDKIRKKD